MKQLFFSLLFLFSLTQTKATCNWQNRISYISIKDTCGLYSVHGYNFEGNVILNNKTGVKYKWTLNGSIKNTTYLFDSYLAKGIYNICLTLTDTLLNCDTSICQSIEINCDFCNWNNRISNVSFKDSCDAYPLQPQFNIYSHVNLKVNSNINYEWKVDGVVKSTGNWLISMLPNGSHNVCLKITDRFLKCDTTICKTVNINCKFCDWSERIGPIIANDSCSSDVLYGRAILFNNLNIKYEWKIDGKSQANSNSSYFEKNLANGTYNVCVKIQDSALLCDTTICRTVIKNCNLSNQSITSNSFNIYPNPAENFITIKNSMNKVLTIFDIKGQKIIELNTVLLENNKVDVQSLLPGLYIIKLENKDGESFYLKFLKA